MKSKAIGSIVILFIIISAGFFIFLFKGQKNTKAQLAQKTEKLQKQVNELNAKIAKMQGNTPAATPTPSPINPNSTNITPGNSTSALSLSPTQSPTIIESTVTPIIVQITTIPSNSEEEAINSLESEIDEMESLYQETEVLLKDIETSVNDLTTAVNNLNTTAQSLEQDLNQMITLAQEAQNTAQTAISTAQEVSLQYKKSLSSTKAIVESRKDLSQAYLSKNTDKINQAETNFTKVLDKEIKTLSTLDKINGNQTFLISFLKKTPQSLMQNQAFLSLFGSSGFSDKFPQLDFTSSLKNIDTNKLDLKKPNTNNIDINIKDSIGGINLPKRTR